MSSMPPSTGSRPDQARAAARHVDLGHVAGHHALGAEPDAGQEHLHLLGRRVLRLVEDDERAVERPPPHEGERRHLDGARGRAGAARPRARAGRRARRRAGRRYGSTLAIRSPGRKPSRSPASTAGRVRMMRVHLARLQGVHGLGHGQVRLAGARRADAERDDVLRDGVDVALLPGRVGAHRLAAGGPHHLGARAPRSGGCPRAPCRWCGPRSTSRGPCRPAP